MTIITWKFDDNNTSVSIDDSSYSKVVLHNGEITIMIDQRKIVNYLNWILNQELKHG